MPTWTEAELALLERANEVQLATARADGQDRGSVPVWVVTIKAGRVFRRSGHRQRGVWFRAARPLVLEDRPQGHADGTTVARIELVS